MHPNAIGNIKQIKIVKRIAKGIERYYWKPVGVYGCLLRGSDVKTYKYCVETWQRFAEFNGIKNYKILN